MKGGSHWDNVVTKAGKYWDMKGGNYWDVNIIERWKELGYLIKVGSHWDVKGGKHWDMVLFRF